MMEPVYNSSGRNPLSPEYHDDAHSTAFLAEAGGNLHEEQSFHRNNNDDDDCSIVNVGISPKIGMGKSHLSLMLQEAGSGLFDVTTTTLQTGARLFRHQRQCVQMGEGSTLLRLLCFIGGFIMVVSSVISLINIVAVLRSPSTYVLQLYQGFFGIVTMIIEAKDWECFDQLKPWIAQWFRFLSVPAGKGAFYVFVGSLGISLWIRNLLSFMVGLYMVFLGVVCVAVHAGTDWNPPDEQDVYDENYINNYDHHVARNRDSDGVEPRYNYDTDHGEEGRYDNLVLRDHPDLMHTSAIVGGTM